VKRRRERQESLTAPTVRELADMLPINTANAFFSVTSAVISLAMDRPQRPRLRVKKDRRRSALLASASVVSGCSPIWASIASDVLSVC
jgi:hypothetical protein